MSDTLSNLHLTTFLSPDFLSDHINHNNNTLFPNNHHHFPYDFHSSSSTESDSDDDDLTGLTRSFTRSLSFQDRPHYLPQKKRVFSGSYPTTSFGQVNDDYCDMIYNAAEQLAMMKMKMNNLNDAVLANKGLLAAPLYHHHHQHYLQNQNHPMLTENQHFHRCITDGVTVYCGCRRGTSGPLGFCPSAWPPVSLETQRRQQPINGSTVKSVSGGFNGGGVAGVKKERAGTGVFIPRNYPNIPTEPKKIPACSSTHMPAGVIKSFTKNMDPIIAPPQPPLQTNVRNGIISQCQVPAPSPHSFNRDELAELITARRNAVRSATNAEVLLPKEWTY
ncbi:hypothetical protein M8C21_000507 [Ambrosia artemisiifolia]|uniref:Uncharacterized protein n=1 Tax=Ambrosia artemisiifolia TaxID=4212 RepID=A0AAD5CD59_AMBAR|nr:hypothetical protein M8C21_000507 [Ambrosia artemisiifolia]